MFLPFSTYFDSGCLMTKPSPLASITSSIRVLISFAVLPLYSTANSIRPFISFRQFRIFFLRNEVDLWRSDCPLRYKRSNTLTEKKSKTNSAGTWHCSYSMDGDCVLSWFYLSFYISRKSRNIEIPTNPKLQFSGSRKGGFVQRRDPIPASRHRGWYYLMDIDPIATTTMLKRRTHQFVGQMPGQWTGLNFLIRYVFRIGKYNPFLS